MGDILCATAVDISRTTETTTKTSDEFRNEDNRHNSCERALRGCRLHQLPCMDVDSCNRPCGRTCVAVRVHGNPACLRMRTRIRKRVRVLSGRARRPAPGEDRARSSQQLVCERHALVVRAENTKRTTSRLEDHAPNDSSGPVQTNDFKLLQSMLTT